VGGLGFAKETPVPPRHPHLAFLLVATAAGLSGASPAAAGSPAQGTGYHMVTPCRLYDSRLGATPLAHGIRTEIAAAGLCGIPSNGTVSALAVNVTITQPTGDGHLVLIAAGTPTPGTTVINFRAGQTRANNALVQLSATGTVEALPIARSATLHLVVDVAGYFALDLPPVATDDSATFAEDDPATAIPVLANDTDEAGEPIFIASATDPASGTVALTGGVSGAHTGLTYEPPADYCNTPPGTDLDTFTYTLTPGGDTATVQVTVTCVNDAPQVGAATFTVDEVSLPGAAVGTVTFSDQDPGQGHSFAITAGNTGGAFAIDAATGAITVADNRALDFCANPTIVTTVEVADDASPPLAGSNAITINLTDLSSGPPAPHVLATIDDGAVEEHALFAQNGGQQLQPGGEAPTACPTDPATNGGCFLVHPLAGDAVNTFDGSESVDPRASCASPRPELSYHWEIFRPPALGSGEYTAAGITGYFGPVLTILPNSLPELAGTAADLDRYWRLRLTLRSEVEPLPETTVALFRFRFADSDLSLAMSEICQQQEAPGPPCEIDNAVQSACGRFCAAPVVVPATFAVDENSPDGTVVGTLTFSDLDESLGDDQAHTFAITAGNVGDAFAIDGSTGQITVANGAALDFATLPTFELEVKVSDDGSPVLEGLGVITVDLNDPPPGVTIAQAAGQADPTAAQPIHFTATFSEPVTGFATSADVALSGTAGTAAATISITPVSTTTYDVAIAGIGGDGSVVVAIPAAAAVDAGGNANTASSSDASVLYEAQSPIVTIDQAPAQADPTNAATVAFAVTFSETVTGFESSDVVFSGTATRGSVGVTGSGAQYTVTVAVSGNGTVTATIPAAAASDAVGNASAAATFTDNTVTRDGTSPTSFLRQSPVNQTDPTQGSTLSFSLQLGEAVVGLTTADFVATASGTGVVETISMTGGGFQYSITLTVTGEGTFQLDLPAGAVTDAAGNPNVPQPADNRITRDTTGPSVTVSQHPTQADPTRDGSMVFVVHFSETVNGFEAGDVVVGGPARPASPEILITPAGGGDYWVEVRGVTSDGAVTVSVPAGAAFDAALNQSLASTATDNSVTRDTVGPTVTINQADSQSDPTRDSAEFTAIFSEPVTGFGVADLVVPGDVGVSVSGSGAVYTVELFYFGGDLERGLSTSIVAGAAVDTAGNASAASTSTDNGVWLDRDPPGVTIDQGSGQADPTFTLPIHFDVYFDEAIVGFTASDVTLSGSAEGLDFATKTLTSIAGGGFRVAVGGLLNTTGTVIATIAGVATDLAGNGNEASTSTDNSVTIDTLASSVTINQAPGQTDPVAGGSVINFRVVFQKPVTGFTSAGVSVSGSAPGAGSASKVVTGSGAVYNVAVSGITGTGTVTATVLAGAAVDVNGTPAATSTSTDNTVTVDTVRPTVTINRAASQADPSNSSTIHFTVVFSEPVTGFAGGDVTLGGTAYRGESASVSGSGTTYDVAVALTGSSDDGTFTASVVANAAIDIVGNTSFASTTSSIRIDRVQPRPRITHPDPDTTSSSTIVFNVRFEHASTGNLDPVTGFTAAGVNLSGTAGLTGATKTVAGVGAFYTVTIAGITSGGTVQIEIFSAAAVDAAGNSSLSGNGPDNVVTYTP
jgi:hypothetical protein